MRHGRVTGSGGGQVRRRWRLRAVDNLPGGGGSGGRARCEGGGGRGEEAGGRRLGGLVDDDALRGQVAELLLRLCLDEALRGELELRWCRGLDDRVAGRHCHDLLYKGAAV